MKYHQHLIVGNGLIGSYLGSILGQRTEVHFVGRRLWLERLQAGVPLSDFEGRSAHYRAAPSQCHETLPDRIENTVIWLTVKNTALTGVLKSLRAKIGKDCLVICCQNGLGAATLTREFLPVTPVLQAIIGFNVIWNEVQQSLHKATQGIVYIERPGADALAELLALKDAGHPMQPLELRDDIEAVAWAKLQLNLANSICAIVNQPVRTMLLDKDCREVIALLMDELLAVVAVKQIALPKLSRVSAYWLPVILRLPTWLFKWVASAMLHIDETARSSMWWDIDSGRLTEVDYLNGAVIQHARLVGIPTPLNDEVVSMIHSLEKANVNRHWPGLDGKSLKFHLQSH